MILLTLFTILSCWAEKAPVAIYRTYQSHDGRMFIEYFKNEHIAPRLMDSTTRKTLYKFPTHPKPKTFAFSHDDSKIAFMYELKNLDDQSYQDRTTVAEPLYVYDIATQTIQKYSFQKNIVPVGNAVHNGTHKPQLSWSADDRFIAIDIEGGETLGAILEARTGRMIMQVGRTPGRMLIAAQRRAGIKTSSRTALGRNKWRDFWGQAITRLAWHPTQASILAIGTRSGKTVLLDVDRLASDPYGARVDLGPALRRTPLINDDKLDTWGFEKEPYDLKWSPDGRYLAVIHEDWIREDKFMVAVFDSETAQFVKRVLIGGVYHWANHLYTTESTIEWTAASRLVVRNDDGQVKLDLDLPPATVSTANPCEIALEKIGVWGRFIQRIKFFFEKVARIL